MRTDLEIVQLPNPLPNWGGLLGKNTVFKDPDFGAEIVRLTDAGDNSASSLQTAGSGNAGIWNKNETLIKVVVSGGKSFIYQFNPVKLQRAAIAAGTVKGKCCFSTVNAGVLFQMDGLIVRKLRFDLVQGKYTLNPLSSVVCDFGKILPAGFSPNWTGTFDVSEGDKSIAVGFSDGIQNTGVYACVWQKGHGPNKGYRLLNTQTGIVTGDWGETGAISLTSSDTKVPFTLHEFSQSPNPRFASVGAFQGGSSPLIWEVATLKLVDSVITGHRAKGWLAVFAGGPGGGQYGKVNYGESWGPKDGPNHVLIVPKEKLPSSVGQQYDGDAHCGFGKISPTDDSIFWVSGQTDITPFTSAWMNEIRGYEVMTGTVYRACHTFNSGKSKEFIAANAMAVPSPTGKLIAFCSDGMGTLGSLSGAPTGTLGVDCRADVFVARLVVP